MFACAHHTESTTKWIEVVLDPFDKKGHAFARPRHHLTVSTRLELVPQELVVNLVVELDLWRLNDGPEQAGAAVG